MVLALVALICFIEWKNIIFSLYFVWHVEFVIWVEG